MQIYKEFEFGELKFTKKELQALDKRIFSFIVGSSIAANDVAILQRLTIMHSHDRSGSEVVNLYMSVNSLVIIRLLAAKIYEYIYFIEGVAKSIRRNTPSELSDFLSCAEEFLLLKNDPEFAAVKDLRDNVTHHYHGATTIGNLKPFNDDQNFSMFLHESTGNSLYSLGEDIGTFGLINSRTDGIGFNEILEWSIKSAGRIAKFQQNTLKLILGLYFPNKKAKMRRIPIEHRFIGDVNTKSPVFFLTKELKLPTTRRRKRS